MNLLRSITRAGFPAALLLLLTAAACRAQTVYVGNQGTNTVQAFSLATGVATPGFTPIALNQPYGLALSGNALYATSNNKLSAYDATTGLALAGFTSVTGFSLPTGLALSGGNIYVADYNTNLISAFNATTGVAVAGYVSPSGLNNPIGLTISGGILYVGNEGNSMVQAFNLATGVAVPGFTPFSLSFPRGLTISGTTLYATSYSGSSLNAYDAGTGTALAGFVTQAAANGLSTPWQVANAGGKLYVVNSSSGSSTITAYNGTTGARDVSYVSPSGLSNPSAIIISVPVPEPGSALLLGGGAALFALRRRRG